jgi:hypothetical protein
VDIVSDGIGLDQSKRQIGRPMHNVTLKFTVTVYIVLVLQTLALNAIVMFEKCLLFGSISERIIVNSTWKQNKRLRSFTLYRN